MRCFVIMPFDDAFEDVYEAIRQGLTLDGLSLECHRLDDVRPAGRISERLISALRASAVCVADLTDCKPNVMWEVGYAMALGKPVILLTQNLGVLPFDIHDMQAIGYTRTALRRTLTVPLRQVIADTLNANPKEPEAAAEDYALTVTNLSIQLTELKEMVGQMVATRSPLLKVPHVASPPALSSLVGSWLNEDSDSNIYVRLIDDVLVAPYCYGGNHELTACYFDWQEMGNYLFARFRWLHRDIEGFTFLRSSGPDLLQGSWWYGEDADDWSPGSPPRTSGNRVVWRRTSNPTPRWALRFFASVSQGDIDNSGKEL